MEFSNSYEDSKRADAYAKLEFPGTYYLAYRDLPQIIMEHVRGKEALDFGCGTGRSTRFLQKLGFKTIGIDISAEMINKARELDPDEDYRVITESNLIQFKNQTFDLALSAFTFDNIPTVQKKMENFKQLARLLREKGILINLVSSPEIYTHEWTSFSTKNFPENKQAKSGDKVRIIQLDTEDKRPVEDILWTDQSYREVYEKAELKITKIHKPLAKKEEPFQWINETKIAPWVIYILQPKREKTNTLTPTN